MHLDQKISLKALNTFGMEVEARYFVEAKTHSEVLTLLNYRHMIHMPILFLGGGSNVLFTRDFAGIVIRINSKGITVREESETHVLVTAEAGENWDEFVRYCVSNGWAGLENLSLIPGTVGASPIQNIGAYGVEVKDVIDSVQVIEIDSGKQRWLSNADCRFGYRDSIFKQTLKGKVIVLNVTFKLIKTSFPDQGSSSSATQPFKVFSLLKLDYGDLRAELQQKNITDPTISDVRDAVCDIRCRKLPDPAEIGNAGSFFKNPMVTEEQAGILSRNFPGMPVHMKQAATNLVKIPAAWLIDQCGWKGYRNGDAGVHVNQPLVLVNYGNATGQQILDLSGKIIASVVSKFGITLEMEVNVV